MLSAHLLMDIRLTAPSCPHKQCCREHPVPSVVSSACELWSGMLAGRWHATKVLLKVAKLFPKASVQSRCPPAICEGSGFTVIAQNVETPTLTACSYCFSLRFCKDKSDRPFMNCLSILLVFSPIYYFMFDMQEFFLGTNPGLLFMLAMLFSFWLPVFQTCVSNWCHLSKE